MASTYQDSAGVERPTQWERVDPDGLESSQVLTPETLREIVHGQTMVFDDPLMPDVGALGWCAGLARERERAVHGSVATRPVKARSAALNPHGSPADIDRPSTPGAFKLKVGSND